MSLQRTALTVAGIAVGVFFMRFLIKKGRECRGNCPFTRKKERVPTEVFEQEPMELVPEPTVMEPVLPETPTKLEEPVKYCPRCKRFLAHSLFVKNTKRKDGLGGRCRECMRDYGRERRKAKQSK